MRFFQQPAKLGRAQFSNFGRHGAEKLNFALVFPNLLTHELHEFPNSRHGKSVNGLPQCRYLTSDDIAGLAAKHVIEASQSCHR